MSPRFSECYEKIAKFSDERCQQRIDVDKVDPLLTQTLHDGIKKRTIMTGSNQSIQWELSIPHRSGKLIFSCKKVEGNFTYVAHQISLSQDDSSCIVEEISIGTASTYEKDLCKKVLQIKSNNPTDVLCYLQAKECKYDPLTKTMGEQKCPYSKTTQKEWEKCEAYFTKLSQKITAKMALGLSTELFKAQSENIDYVYQTYQSCSDETRELQDQQSVRSPKAESYLIKTKAVTGRQ